MSSNESTSSLPIAGVVAVWVPALVAASYVWGHGEYYDYGWFVPPAALWLLIRRWQGLGGPVVLPQARRLLMVAGLLVPWLLVLRVLGYADAAWRLPIILLGLTAAFASHWLIAVSGGWRVSAGFVWISLFALSAVPWPTVVESGIIHHLTQAVVTAVAEVFQIFGKPVEAVGDRLRLYDLTVEVTDGCSGVRSFQSFVMASWFFVELQHLRLTRAVILLVSACGMAFAVNMARTYALARIRFDFGEEAFVRAHDWLGLLAFLLSGLFFYVLSGRLSAAPRRTVVTTVTTPIQSL